MFWGGFLFLLAGVLVRGGCGFFGGLRGLFFFCRSFRNLDFRIFIIIGDRVGVGCSFGLRFACFRVLVFSFDFFGVFGTVVGGG